MKKQNANKLHLSRETLVPLQPEVLDGVNGGLILPPVTLACPTLTCIISRLVCR